MATPSDFPSRTLTFLYTDIEGSTLLWERHRAAMETAMSRHDQILREAIEAHDGQIFRTVGDGVCAIFDNASHAVAAALQAQRLLQTGSWEDTGPLKVRMVLHTGEAEARHGDFFGSSLNRIGRLLEVAYGGQILLSQATQLLVQDHLPEGASLMDLGEIRLRDLSYAEHVFQLLARDLWADFPPLLSLNRHPNNLPSQPTALIGRDVERAELARQLKTDAIRLVTLTGPGGTGKTRLALQVAADLIEEFENGVYFVDLAAIRDPEAVLPAIGRATSLRDTSERPILEELANFLQAKRMLLLLDNFEQITRAAPKVMDLLLVCPAIKLLVTSREALRVRGEHIFPVPPLSLPIHDGRGAAIGELAQSGAIQLFVDRARAVRPDFQLTGENAQAVAEICVRLDGLPLAIELAAARLNIFPPQALLERLGSGLKMLRGARDLPTRQQTLRDTIDWSYQLLSQREQDVFTLFSVFAGGSFEAIEGVAGQIKRLNENGNDNLEDAVSLVDKSLIRRVEQEHGEPRLLMLETIREYAADRLNETPEYLAEAKKGHASYFADFTRRQWERLNGENREAALADLTTEIDNIRSAWRFWVAEKDLGQLGKFTDSLWQLYDARGWYHALIDLTTNLLNVLSPMQPTPELAEQELILQTSLAHLILAVNGYTADLERAYSRAIELSQKIGDISHLFPVLRGLAGFYMLTAEFEKALPLGEQILRLAEQYGDVSLQVEGHLAVGSILAFLDQLAQGLDHLEKGMALFDPAQSQTYRYRIGNNPGVVCTATSALALWMLGLPDRAVQRGGEAINLARRLDHPYSIAYAYFHNSLLHYWLGEADQTYGCAQTVLELAEEHDFQLWNAVGLCLAGAGVAGKGNADEGLSMISQGMKLYQGLKTPPVFWPNLLLIKADVCRLASRPDEGLDILDEAMRLSGEAASGALPADGCRLKAELLRLSHPDDFNQAESWFERALTMARGVRSPMVELRAAIGLSRLWGDIGKAEQGRQIVRDAYQKFTEGFATADLREARAILES